MARYLFLVVQIVCMRSVYVCEVCDVFEVCLHFRGGVNSLLLVVQPSVSLVRLNW